MAALLGVNFFPPVCNKVAFVLRLAAYFTNRLGTYNWLILLNIFLRKYGFLFAGRLIVENRSRDDVG